MLQKMFIRMFFTVSMIGLLTIKIIMLLKTCPAQASIAAHILKIKYCPQYHRHIQTGRRADTSGYHTVPRSLTP